MSDARSQTLLERMIQNQIVGRGLTEPRLIDALRSVPREVFFPGTSDEDPFGDHAASIGHGQTISQPFIVAFMTARLQLDAGHRVLEIGTGSGYQTAVLARLAREVYTIERVKPLLDEAFERVSSLGIKNVHYRYADGTLGWPEAVPFDRILIAAGAPRIPEHLLKTHLAEEGLAVLPVGAAEDQKLMLVRHRRNRLEQSELIPVRFVPLIGNEGWKETK